jgi:hypothetical protein
MIWSKERAMTRSRNDEPNPRYNRMHLFLIRVWHEPGSDSATELHGRLQRVVSGETRAFVGLDGLSALLEELVTPKAHHAQAHREQMETPFAATPPSDEPESRQ